jgi:hypothetical protein
VQKELCRVALVPSHSLTFAAIDSHFKGAVRAGRIDHLTPDGRVPSGQEASQLA